MRSFIANHFGVGAYEGAVAIAYGRYVDKLKKTDEGWRIYQRELVYMVRHSLLGNIDPLNTAN